MIITKKCKYEKCGKEFSYGSSYSSHKVYCSLECRHEQFFGKKEPKKNINYITGKRVYKQREGGRIQQELNELERERKANWKLLNESIFDTDSCDQGAYL